MRFENLQAIWDTQNEQPVFAMKDARLLLALYQQREQSRRRLWWTQFAPMYGVSLGMLAGTFFIFVAFYYKSLYIQKIARDFPMSFWDYIVFGLAAGSLLAIVGLLYAERKKHERIQNVFAPSLREELDRGLAQLDFELSLYSTPWNVKMIGLTNAAALLFCWEVGRLNGDPVPWKLMLILLPCVVAGIASTSGIRKRKLKQVLPRRRALESMIAALDETR
jgi:hypothetical protein